MGFVASEGALLRSLGLELLESLVADQSAKENEQARQYFSLTCLHAILAIDSTQKQCKVWSQAL
jgi:hypothetical protein